MVFLPSRQTPTCPLIKYKKLHDYPLSVPRNRSSVLDGGATLYTWKYERINLQFRALKIEKGGGEIWFPVHGTPRWPLHTSSSIDSRESAERVSRSVAIIRGSSYTLEACACNTRGPLEQVQVRAGHFRCRLSTVPVVAHACCPIHKLIETRM